MQRTREFAERVTQGGVQARRLLCLLLLVYGAALVAACGGAAESTEEPAAAGERSKLSGVMLRTPAPIRPAPAPPPSTPPQVSDAGGSGGDAVAGPAPLPPAGGWPYVPRAERPDGSQPVVALTFDMDASAGYTGPILDILARYGVRASFAVTGIWAQANPDLMMRVVSEGHVVMNHSWNHPSFTGISRAERMWQLEATESLIMSMTGVSTKPYFRPPYGNLDSSVFVDVADAGYGEVVMWSIDPQGWRGVGAETVVWDVFQNVHDGAVVLFHLANIGDYLALEPIIEGLGNAGYRFVGIDAMYWGSGVEPEPEPVPSPEPAPPPIPTPVPTPVPTMEPVPMPSPSPVPVPSATPEPASTPEPTLEPSPAAGDGE